MKKWIAIIGILICAKAQATTVYDYASGSFVVLPNSTAPTFNTVTASTMTTSVLTASSAAFTNATISTGTVSNATIQLLSETLTQLQATAVSAGTLGYCSNCSTDAACVSTGTIHGFVRMNARSTVCQ
jgi:hypothetical protein